MNIELIIKLAKLANNNPNDNEANAAARKVCKLLAEGNFQFTITTQSTRPNPSRPTQGEPQQSRAGQSWTYDEAQARYDTREYEYYTRKNPFTQGGPDNPFDFAAMYDEVVREQQRQRRQKGYPDFDIRKEQEKERARRQKEVDEYERRKRDEELKARLEKEERDRQKGYNFNQEKKPMRCNKCGQSKMTSFIGPPELFICNSCLWDVVEEKL